MFIIGRFFLEGGGWGLENTRHFLNYWKHFQRKFLKKNNDNNDDKYNENDNSNSRSGSMLKVLMINNDNNFNSVFKTTLT